jgi:hypothetical protein
MSSATTSAGTVAALLTVCGVLSSTPASPPAVSSTAVAVATRFEAVGPAAVAAACDAWRTLVARFDRSDAAESPTSLQAATTRAAAPRGAFAPAIWVATAPRERALEF